MDKYFFNETNNTLNYLSNLYDTIWPLSAGIWIARKEIEKQIEAQPNVDNSFFINKYSTPSGLHGVNYIKNFVNKTWEEQKNELSISLLNQSIALFEGWLDSIINNHFPVVDGAGSIDLDKTGKRIKRLQFDEKIGNEMIIILSDESLFSKNHLYPMYSRKQKGDYSKIVGFLSCFRVFKEIRNAIMHHNSKVTQILVERKTTFGDLHLTSADLKATCLPDFSFIGSVGDNIMLPIRMAVYATDIIIKIISSLDTEFIKTKSAEKLLINRFKNSPYYGEKMQSQQKLKIKQLKKFFMNGLGVHSPTNLIQCESFFIDNNLVVK